MGQHHAGDSSIIFAPGQGTGAHGNPVEPRQANPLRHSAIRRLSLDTCLYPPPRCFSGFPHLSNWPSLSPKRSVSRGLYRTSTTISLSRRGCPQGGANPRIHGELETMCQPLQQTGPSRSAWSRVLEWITELGGLAAGLRSTWVRLRRVGRGETARAARMEGVHGSMVQLGGETSDGHFSRTATITGSFSTTSRCCGKDDEVCRGGTSNQNWGSAGNTTGETAGDKMELIFERGRTLARGGRRGRAGVAYLRSSERSPTLTANSQLLRQGGAGRGRDTGYHPPTLLESWASINSKATQGPDHPVHPVAWQQSANFRGS